MVDVLEPLAGQRQKGERGTAVLACNDWLRMGPGRSLPELHRRYTETNQDSPPTLSLGTLKQWSARFGWAKRAELYDAEEEARKNARRDEIMETGLALVHERVEELKQLGGFLLEQIFTESEEGTLDNLWLPDVKQVGGGENAERVDIVRFNANLVEQARRVLDDLAKETGARGSKFETRNLNIDISQLTNEQLERIASGEDPLVVLATSSPSGA